MIRRLAHKGTVTSDAADEAVRMLVQLDPVVPLTRVLLPRMWELRANLTAHDAAYVAAAEAYDCALLTADARLARSPGIRCRLEVIQT